MERILQLRTYPMLTICMGSHTIYMGTHINVAKGPIRGADQLCHLVTDPSSHDARSKYYGNYDSKDFRDTVGWGSRHRE